MSNVPKITEEDLAGLGVTALPDVPGIAPAELKRKFEEILRDVVIPKINDVIDAVYTGLPVATEDNVGGIMAEPAESSDVQPVRIGEDGKLYTGEYHVDDALNTESRFPVQNRVLTTELGALTTELGQTRLDLGNFLQLSTASGAGLHNSIYRGKYLGDTLTSAQSAAIRAGTFTDLWIGDYWTINGVNYRIADFDYYLHSGDTELTTHHVVIVTDTSLYSAQMNTTDTTAGGYAGSAMRTSGLNSAKSTITTAFGDHVLPHRELLGNAMSNGITSGWSWYDSTVELLSEHMVYGSYVFGGGAHVSYDTGNSRSQLALFRLRHDSEHTRPASYWLRDVRSATFFCAVSNKGEATFVSASSSYGVRPVFLIY